MACHIPMMEKQLSMIASHLKILGDIQRHWWHDTDGDGDHPECDWNSCWHPVSLDELTRYSGTLPFGAASSCLIFEKVVTLLEWYWQMTFVPLSGWLPTTTHMWRGHTELYPWIHRYNATDRHAQWQKRRPYPPPNSCCTWDSSLIFCGKCWPSQMTREHTA